MSTETTSWAKLQRCGCPNTKAVLIELANWARPDGMCEFRKVSDIAFVTELSERTVQRCLKRLEDPISDGGLGLMRRVARARKDGGTSASGFELVGYIYPGDTQSPPRVTHSHPPGCQTVTPRVTGGRGRGCQAVTPNKELDLDNNTPLTPRAGGRKKRFQIPDDWKAPVLADLPPAAQAAASRWPAGAYEAQTEAFIGWYRGKGQRFADWDDLWVAWVAQKHDVVMRSAKAGLSFIPAPTGAGRPAAPKPETAAKCREDQRSSELHDVLRDALGQLLWENWWRPAALIMNDDQLTIVCPSSHHREFLEERHAGAVTAALNVLGWSFDHVRWDVQSPAAKRKRAA